MDHSEARILAPLLPHPLGNGTLFTHGKAQSARRNDIEAIRERGQDLGGTGAGFGDVGGAAEVEAVFGGSSPPDPGKSEERNPGFLAGGLSGD